MTFNLVSEMKLFRLLKLNVQKYAIQNTLQV